VAAPHRPLVGLAAAAGSGDEALRARGLLRVRGGLCLHARKPYGSPVFLGKCDSGSLSQQWQYTEQGLLQHDFAGCLDRGGKTVHMWFCDPANPSQRWAYRMADGALSDPEHKICLQAPLPHAPLSPAVFAICANDEPRQEWSLAIRAGQIQLDAGSCLSISGGELALQDCARNATLDWELDLSSGQLRHCATDMCASGRAADRVELESCLRQDSFADRQWTFSRSDGKLRTVGGDCLFSEAASGRGAPSLAPCGNRSMAWRVGVAGGQIKHRHGVCLNALAKPGAALEMWACELAEMWSYYDEDGTLRRPGGMCLEVADEAVVLMACKVGEPNQQWYADEASISHNGRCLTAATPGLHGSPVRLVECDVRQWTQEWALMDTGRQTPILTVETRSPLNMMPVKGVPGRTMENIGVGKPWQGFGTKPRQYLPAMEALAQKEPNKLVILADSDIAFGGCSEEVLLARYRMIVENSGGASVVVSADINQYPPVEDGKRRFAEIFGARRARVMTAFGLDTEAVDRWKCHVDNFQVDSYQFINSGFIMGPADELRKVLSCMLDEGWDHNCLRKPSCSIDGNAPRREAGEGDQCCFDDQRALTLCALKHPDRIAIDYASTLMMTTFGMENMFTIREDSIYSKAIGETQCFIHGNAEDSMQPVQWDAWTSSLKDHFHGAV